MSAPPLIQARDLAVGHDGKAVLQVASLEIREGSSWAIVGPNGSGKTTLLRTLLGELAPVSGAVDRDASLAPGRQTC